jgi:hypothetical protein
VLPDLTGSTEPTRTVRHLAQTSTVNPTTNLPSSWQGFVASSVDTSRVTTPSDTSGQDATRSHAGPVSPF